MVLSPGLHHKVRHCGCRYHLDTTSASHATVAKGRQSASPTSPKTSIPLKVSVVSVDRAARLSVQSESSDCRYTRVKRAERQRQPVESLQSGRTAKLGRMFKGMLLLSAGSDHCSNLTSDITRQNGHQLTFERLNDLWVVMCSPALAAVLGAGSKRSVVSKNNRTSG